MSDPVETVKRQVRMRWKKRALQAEKENADLRLKLFQYGSAAVVTAVIAVACLLFALLK